MKFPLLVPLILLVAACNSPSLPELDATGPSSPEAPTAAAPYRPVLAGTAAYGPVGLKSWRELNEEVTPAAGKSP